MNVRPRVAWPNWHRPGSAVLLFRWLIFLLLLAAGVSMAFYLATGKPHFRRWGVLTLKWTLLAALGFFAVLILERVL